MSEAEVEDFLAHYGVMGMRWGKRKGGDTGKALLDAKTGEVSKGTYKVGDTKDHVVSREAAKKPLREMTDGEIQDFIKRADLEKRYRELTAEKSKIDKGHDKIKKFLDIADTSGRVYKLVKSEHGQAAIKLVMKNIAEAKK